MATSKDQIGAITVVKQIKAIKPELIDFEQLSAGIREYVEEQGKDNSPLNIVNLAAKFGMSVQQFKEGKGIHKDRYTSEMIKRAFILCEADLAKRLNNGGNSINLIFYAKNVHGWKDKQEVNNTHEIRIKRTLYADSRPGRPKKSDIVTE